MPDPPGTEWLRSQTQRLQANNSPSFISAMNELKLTPQEQYIYQHHLGNLSQGGVRQPNGKLSTFLNIISSFGDRAYILPTVWDNKILEQNAAIERARQAGLHNFPSYGTVEEAEQRYQAIHGYMERDSANR